MQSTGLSTSSNQPETQGQQRNLGRQGRCQMTSAISQQHQSTKTWNLMDGEVYSWHKWHQGERQISIMRKEGTSDKTSSHHAVLQSLQGYFDSTKGEDGLCLSLQICHSNNSWHLQGGFPLPPWKVMGIFPPVNLLLNQTTPWNFSKFSYFQNSRVWFLYCFI